MQDIDIEEQETEDTQSVYASENILADWVNKPTVTKLKQDLTQATSAHNTHVANVGRWLDNLNVKGSAQVKARTGKSKIVPKLIRKQAEWRYAALSEPFLSTQDIFKLSPVTWDDKKSAEQNQLVLNNQFNTKINRTNFIDTFIRAAVDEGTVITRVGWDYEEKIVKVEVPVFEYVPSQDPKVMEQHKQIHQLMQVQPEQYNELPEELRNAHTILMEQGTLVTPVVRGTEIKDDIIVLKNQPTVEVCDYNNVIVDPTCAGNLEKANFIIFSFETSLAELKKDGKYTNLETIEIEGSSVLNTPDHAAVDDTNFTFSDKARKKFVAYEYWGFWDINKDGNVVPIVATWVKNTMIRLEENPFPDKKHPFVSVQYLPKRREVYGEPDGELLEDNQKIVGAVTRGIIDTMARSANGQVATRKDALDLTNKRRFDNGLDYEFNANVDPRQAFHMHTYPEIPKSAEFMLNLQNAEAESITGVKAFTGGISGQALGNTATGIRGALDATSKRELGILRRLSDGMKAIGRKIISMNSEFLSDVEVVRITNSQFVEVKRDDLAGKFDIVLDISTAETDNQKAQELAFMLQTMGNSMDFNISKIILIDIAKLRKMPELAKKIEEYEPQPNPLVQAKAELEVELLKAQVQNEYAKAEENKIDAQYKLARMGTETAKARNLESKSDAQDLEFVHKQTGEDTRREIEKKDFDRKANLDLKAAEHLLKGQEENVA